MHEPLALAPAEPGPGAVAAALTRALHAVGLVDDDGHVDPSRLQGRRPPHVADIAAHLVVALGGEEVRCGPLRLDVREGVALARGRYLALTPLEFGVLRVLAEREGSVVPKRTLLAEVWGDPARGEGIVETYVSYVRRKLAGLPVYIDTHRARGYRLSTLPAAA